MLHARARSQHWRALQAGRTCFALGRGPKFDADAASYCSTASANARLRVFVALAHGRSSAQCQSGRSAPARAAAAQCTLTPAVWSYIRNARVTHTTLALYILVTVVLRLRCARARVQFVYIEGTFYIMHAYMFNLYYAQGESIVHNIKSRLSFSVLRR